MNKAAIRSKLVVLLLLIYCLYLLPLFVGILCFVLDLLFCHCLDGEESERAGCFALTVFLQMMSCDSQVNFGWYSDNTSMHILHTQIVCICDMFRFSRIGEGS